MNHSNELCHYGVKGMRWGVRRYQDKNGRLTNAGKKRYSGDNGGSESEAKKGLSDNKKRAIKIGAAAVGTALAAYGGYKLYKSGKLDSSIAKGKRAVDQLLGEHRVKPSDFVDSIGKSSKRETIRRNASKSVKNRIKSMSDTELKAAIDRLENERKLKNLISDDNSAGKKVVQEILSNSGKKVLGSVVTGASLYGIKYAITKKFDAEEAGGYIAPKPKNK